MGSKINAGLVMGVVVFSYLIVQEASALEDISNSDVLLVSLPIKRTTIILPKYMSISNFDYSVYFISFARA